MIHLFTILAQMDLTATQNLLITGISVLWGSLVGAIVAMWKFLGKRLANCEKDRKELWETLAHHGINRTHRNNP